MLSKKLGADLQVTTVTVRDTLNGRSTIVVVVYDKQQEHELRAVFVLRHSGSLAWRLVC